MLDGFFCGYDVIVIDIAVSIFIVVSVAVLLMQLLCCCSFNFVVSVVAVAFSDAIFLLLLQLDYKIPRQGNNFISDVVIMLAGNNPKRLNYSVRFNSTRTKIKVKKSLLSFVIV